MSVDAFIRIDTVSDHDINFTVGSQIKACPFLFEHINQSVVRQRFKRIMKGYARKGRFESSILMSNSGLIKHE
jgi:hypothetical protein